MKHTLKTLVPAALALLALSAPATAQRPVGQPASIPFADHGGIRDFRADGSKAIYLQDNRGQWYRAEFMGSCPGINFAETIAYETDASGRFDQFSKIRTREQVCAISSLVTANAPKGKAKAAQKG